MGGLKLGKEAQSKYDEAKISPDVEGYLEKKGAKRKNWNTRWFVLKDNYLFYAKNNKSNPQGIINLHGCTVSRIEGPTARAYSFSLLAPKSVSIDAKWTNRTYFMAAKDAKEMEKWMSTLQDSGRKAVEAAAKKNAEKAQNAAAHAAANNNSSLSAAATPPSEVSSPVIANTTGTSNTAKTGGQDDSSSEEEGSDGEKKSPRPVWKAASDEEEEKKEKKKKKDRKHKKEKKEKKREDRKEGNFRR